jgi:hypothetical protein
VAVNPSILDYLAQQLDLSMVIGGLPMFDLPPKADIRWQLFDVHLVPLAAN